MGNAGYNGGVSKWGTSFSSLRSTRRKRRLSILEKKGHSFVYFIQAENGMVKIGYARVPYIRWRTLQSASPMALKILVYATGDSVTEERLHSAFAAYRGNGEWFKPEPALMAYIDDLKAATDWRDFRG